MKKSKLRKSNISLEKSNRTNHNSPVRNKSVVGWITKTGIAAFRLRLFMIFGILMLLVLLGFVVWIKGCDGDHHENEEFIPVQVAVEADNDTIISTSVENTYNTKQEVPAEREVSEQTTETKKKPIDPRFQYPDGRYKQPHEYMEYFNEDYDDEDEYEDGYEDGYDDAQDEF